MTDPSINDRLESTLIGVTSQSELLQAELERCWLDVERLRDELSGLRAERPATAARPNLDALLAERRDVRQHVLDPVSVAWRRLQPFRRALRAVDRFESRLRQQVDTTPPMVSVEGSELVEWLGEWGAEKRWWYPLLRLKRRPVALGARAALRRETTKRLKEHARIEATYFRFLAEAALGLVTEWEAAADGQVPALYRARASGDEELPRILGRWQSWSSRSRAALARRLAATALWGRLGRSPDAWQTPDGVDWWIVLRTLETEWKGDDALLVAEDVMFQAARDMVEDVSKETASVAAALETATTRLSTLGPDDALPAAAELETRITPSVHRLARFEAMLRDAYEHVPVHETVIASLPRRPRPGFRLRDIRPRETLGQAFERRTLPAVATLLGQVESRHAAILRQVGEAYDVLSFANEIADEASDGATLRSEAQSNALATLASAREELRASAGADVESGLVAALTAGLEEGRLLLGRDRVGAWRHLTQQGLRRGSVSAIRTAGSWAVRGFTAASAALERGARAGLVRIGWAPGDDSDARDIKVRAYLPREFTSLASRNPLPPLYERLFRLEPLEDERFLVGRERELAGLAQAKELWASGRPVAVIVVGERGSGKTSLMNCALNEALAGPEVVRGQFGCRVTTEEELRKFLADLLGVENPADLEAELAARRPLIVIEELERTFLRHIGNFGAVRALQRLIAQTSDTTLWVLVTNQIAFRLLDAAVGLGQTFSHRVNAATISRDDLKRAILMRQKLSGLRVRYPAPPVERGPGARLRRLADSQPDPERVFFDTLAEESFGVYRTALTLWRHHIERIERGVLWLRPIVPPDLSSVTETLDLADLFSLVAIQQHGSLTVEEHAIVFQHSLAASRAQIDELLNRELVESDPVHAGFRVRPQALRAVREALYRRNLL